MQANGSQKPLRSNCLEIRGPELVVARGGCRRVGLRRAGICAFGVGAGRRCGAAHMVCGGGRRCLCVRPGERHAPLRDWCAGRGAVALSAGGAAGAASALASASGGGVDGSMRRPIGWIGTLRTAGGGDSARAEAAVAGADGATLGAAHVSVAGRAAVTGTGRRRRRGQAGRARPPNAAGRSCRRRVPRSASARSGCGRGSGCLVPQLQTT